MLKRFLELSDILPDCSFDNDVMEMIPTVAEKRGIKKLCEDLEFLEGHSKFLQTNDSEKVNLLTVRVSFDQIIDRFPAMDHHLGPDATIVHSPDFESAVRKVMLEDERSLTHREKESIAAFRVDVHDGDAAEEEEKEGEEKQQDKVAQQIMRGANELKQKKHKAAVYRSMSHISPTSNLVERLFSAAKHVATVTRSRMDPSTLELLLILKCNSDLWDAATLDAILNDEEVEN
jgi:hypothetical protein